MADAWDEVAGGWDASEDVRRYAGLAFEALGGVATLDAGARVLDFGCGTGLLTALVAPHVAEVVAVDTSARMIDALRAKGLARVTALHMDILAADRVPEGFDLILASSVCAFVPDYPAAALRLAGLLGAGGRFVQWDWEGQGDGAGLSDAQIAEALAQAGLGEVAVTRPFEMETMPVLMGTGVRVAG